MTKERLIADKLIALAADEMRQASEPFLDMELFVTEAMGLLGMLQLVLRHPGLPDSMTELARQIAETIECQLSSVGPATREICRRSRR